MTELEEWVERNEEASDEWINQMLSSYEDIETSEIPLSYMYCY